MLTNKADQDEVFRAFFGEAPSDAVPLRGVRLKVQPTGDLTLAHPKATGECIVIVQQVPVTVPASEVLTRMRKTTLTRRGSADFGGSVVVAWGEIAGDATGLILR